MLRIWGSFLMSHHSAAIHHLIFYSGCIRNPKNFIAMSQWTRPSNWDRTLKPIKIADCYSWIRYITSTESSVTCNFPQSFLPPLHCIHLVLWEARHETQNWSDESLIYFVTPRGQRCLNVPAGFSHVIFLKGGSSEIELVHFHKTNGTLLPAK